MRFQDLRYALRGLRRSPGFTLTAVLSRLVRQFLTESLLLSGLGGAAGVLLASRGVAAIRAAGPADLPRLEEIGVDGTVLGFAVLLSIVTGLLFGLAPALHATRDQVQTTLKGASQGGSARVSATAAEPRFNGSLLGLFAAVAVLLSAIGLYGVIAYAVNRRTREIGIRMAPGATSRDILRLVARQGLRPLAVGLAVGLVGAYFAVRVLASRLFEVLPHDTAVFVLAPAGLALVALAASWAPARRAMRLDPAASLRQE